MNNNNDYQKYVLSLMILTLPWAIFLILTILTFLITCCCCCCRSKPRRKPEPKRLNNFFLLIFSLTLIAFSMGGMIVAP